jgi:hypothetical protein
MRSMETKALNDISFLAGFLAGRELRRRDEETGRGLLHAEGITRVAKMMRDTQGASVSECAGVMFGYENPDWTCPDIERVDAERNGSDL